MKRLSSLFLLLCLSILAFAQPKNAWKATALLTAYDASGQQVYSGPAFFIDGKGTVVAPYTPFTKAVRAEVTDAKGKVNSVERILGASENYNFVKLSTTAEPADFLIPIADSTQVPAEGSKLYAVGYLRTKKEAPVAATVRKAQRYDAAMFYETSLPAEDRYVGCPLIDTQGRVVAVAGSHAGEALDIRFATALSIMPQSALDRELRALPMKKGLPAAEADALKYISLLDAVDPNDALAAMNDFLQLYPQNAAGLVERATRLAAMKRYAEAEADFKSALSCADGQTTEPSVHLAFSRSLLSAAQSDTTAAAQGWTLQRALSEADAAAASGAEPLYTLQQAGILFAMERYDESYHKYMEVNKSDIATDETYLAAMLALERANGDTAQILALLDKAIDMQQRPYTQRAANIFFQRAQRLVAYGQYRRAVADYNEFERIIGPRKLTDTFYFMREQAELSAHMYQQALDDIQSAILSASDERKPYYQTEEALIYLTCGEYESAKTSGQAALEKLPNHIPLLRILAVAHGETNNKAYARQLLERAKSLGDTEADTLLQKYQ